MKVASGSKASGPGRERVRAAARGDGAQIHQPCALARASSSCCRRVRRSWETFATHRISRSPGSWSSSSRWTVPGSRPAYRPVATDAGGHFEILGLAPGRFRLVARHRELAPALSDVLPLAEGGEEQVDLVLRPGVTVAGRLVGPDQRAARGSVMLAEIDGRTAPDTLVETSTSAAGEDGRFRVAHVPPGSHALAVVAPGFTPQRVELSVGSKPVDLGDVTLETGLLIEGRVVDSSRAPVLDAELEATPASVIRRIDEESPLRTGRSDAAGRFVIGGLGEGTYELRAQAYGFGQVARPVEAGAKGVTLAPQPAGSVSGLVVDEGQNPVADFRVLAQMSRAEGDVRAWPQRYVKPFTTADGRFLLEGVSAGTYVVDVSAPEHVTLTVKDVLVQSGSASDLGRLVLRAGGTRRGTVVNGEGAAVAGADVTVSTGFGPRLVEPPRTTTNGEGLFTLGGIPPGQVEVVASHPSYADGRSRIEVDPASGYAEVRIVLGQGASLQGSVRQRDGSGVPAVTIQLLPLEPDGRPRSVGQYAVETASDGSFVLERLPAGPAMVVLMGGGRRTQASSRTRNVELRDGQATTVDFVLRDVRITGILTRQQAPVPGAHLAFQPQGQAMTVITTTSGSALASPSGDPLRNQAITGSDGRFEPLLDEAGPYNVEVSFADGKATHSRPVQIPDTDVHELEIDISGASVSGAVVEKGTDRPLSAVRLVFSPLADGSGLVLPRPALTAGSRSISSPAATA